MEFFIGEMVDTKAEKAYDKREGMDKGVIK